MLVNRVHTEPDGIVLTTSTGRIRLQRVTDAIMRVTFTGRDTFATTTSLGVLPHTPTAPSLVDEAGRLTVSTPQLTVVVDKGTGVFSWFDPAGDLLVREPDDGLDTKVLREVDVMLTSFDPDAPRIRVPGTDGMKTVAVGGRQTRDRGAYATTLRLRLEPDEAVYGLGQHEEGFFDYHGHDQDLYQQNLKVAVPVLVSSRGYGIVWDSYSLARFTSAADNAQLWTDVDDELDYYVIVGPELDDVVAGVRTLTGRVPMLPRWALGYIQSKERYHDQQELLDVVHEFRRRRIPLDVIVQDWKTWPGDLWGQKSFDPERFPDPDDLCRRLHDDHVHLMVSIWPNLQGDGPNHVEMRERGYLLGDDSTYDARTPEARALYWRQAADGYFRHGVDGWWADCTEPFEADWTGAERPGPDQRRELNVGTAKKYLDPEHVNAYSLLHTQGLYEGQRAADDTKRVMVLTRSASLGQQRYGAVTWSGDISATWDVLRRQVAEGLSFCLTGNPRWNSDVGAFFVGADDDLWFWKGDFPSGVDDLGYRELYVRWLQAATFMPLMRSHGTETPREPWRFGEPGDAAYDTIVAFIRLRYRLLPYLYSLHAWETLHDYTSMRALVFDFRHDPATHRIADQFMVGPALLVCPVTEPMTHGPGSAPIVRERRSRAVYLPDGTDWYDFWTGERFEGGRTVEVHTPLSTLPLFVRAGSILPLGPDVEYADAAPVGPLEIRVYPGADGSFELYDDSGDGYGYERGEYATVGLRWNQRDRVLAASARRGIFPGMPAAVAGSVVAVTPGAGAGTGRHQGRSLVIGSEAAEVRLDR